MFLVSYIVILYVNIYFRIRMIDIRDENKNYKIAKTQAHFKS